MEKAETNKILLDVFERLKLVCSRFTELNGVIWDKVGHPLLTTLTDNPQTLIDFLQQEYHANHTIDPLIEKLREKLIEVGDIFWHQEYYDSQELYESYFDLVSECRTWQKWIDQYYPPEQSKQEPGQEEPIKQDNKPKRISAAAKKLATPELQAVKQELVDAGLIKDGKWTGSTAEFGCLVLELLEQYKVATNGGRAWTACKNWAGYEDSIKSARNANDANPNTRGDNAETIRRICKKK